MNGERQPDQLDREILTAAGELVRRIVAQGEAVAQRFSFPAFSLKALHMLECPMAMKELGRRMHCDPSFVTVIADGLEKRGLVRREAHPGDRRVKNLVLTQEGSELRDQVESVMTAAMPWSQALTRQERETLLALIRKMTSAEGAPAEAVVSSPAAATEEVPGDLNAAAPTSH
jgi:MarR family transcriptional regulator, organic hydroperoxide resistance regulator